MCPDVASRSRGSASATARSRRSTASTCDVARGEVVAILGPNGAGKTTTVEILEGYRSRDGGDVRVLGEDPQRRRPRVALADRHRAAEHQRPRRGDGRRAGPALRAVLPGPARPRRGDRRRRPAARRSRTRARQLSGGQRRRLDVALGIVGRPELLFLDEPTTGFDPQARRSFWDLVDALRGRRHDDPAHHALPRGGRAPRRPGRGRAATGTVVAEGAAGATSAAAPRGRRWCAGRRTGSRARSAPTRRPQTVPS